MRESVIEKTVCVYARRQGWLVYKFVSPGIRGVPDRLFIKNGVVLFIEFKAPGRKVNRLQEIQLARLIRENMIVEIVDDIDKGKAVIDGYSEKAAKESG